MVQDQFDPELYLKCYTAVNSATGHKVRESVAHPTSVVSLGFSARFINVVPVDSAIRVAVSIFFPVVDV